LGCGLEIELRSQRGRSLILGGSTFWYSCSSSRILKALSGTSKKNRWNMRNHSLREDPREATRTFSRPTRSISQPAAWPDPATPAPGRCSQKPPPACATRGVGMGPYISDPRKIEIEGLESWSHSFRTSRYPLKAETPGPIFQD